MEEHQRGKSSAVTVCNNLMKFGGRLLMSKKHIHIISHTHWDREWYLPYEKHHVKLIKLVDELLETLDNNADFKSFHLDGQTIILDDYLQIRPEMKERIQHYIKEGRIHVYS